MKTLFVKLLICAVASVLVIALVVGITLALVIRTDDSSDDPTEVLTQSGTVTGKISETTTGTTIYEFFNIPYASPPVGADRFQPPKLKNASNPWDEAVDASVENLIQCIQYTDGAGTEDCLVLTIRTTNVSASRPVIVWIHGGGMMSGYCCQRGYSFDSDRTMELDAVTVNVNYRLGILGFNSIEDLWEEGVYANNGIRDLITALEWVQENIAGFGGDPNSVTIIGESGGATAVLGIVSSPLAVDKFHRAVSLSPAPEMRFNHSEGNEFQQSLYGINTGLNCIQDNKADRKACLMAVPAEQFSLAGDGVAGKLSSVASMSAYFDFPLRYGYNGEYMGLAITDPTVVTQSPRDLASAEDINPSSKVKVIISNLAQENGIMRYVYQDPTNVYSTTTDLDAALTTWYSNLTTDPDILNKTYEMYPDTTPQAIWETLTTDLRSTCPSNDVALAMAESSHHDIYRLYITNSPAEGDPAYHAWDTIALFNFLFYTDLGIVVSDSWAQFGDKLVEILAGFAEDGSLPTGWDTFPNKSMTLTSDLDEMEVTSTDKPQGEVCEQLRALDLVKYGWQN